MTRAAALALLALAGCGDYSTEDLRFLVALPQREDLRVEVPADAAAAAAVAAKGTAISQAPTAACALGEAEIWLWAKPTSDKLNALVDFLVGLVDAVRGFPPTGREEDARWWGPFDDRNHPGREIVIGIARTWPAELGGAPRHVYVFQARVKGTPDFTTVLLGTFDGATAARGQGALALDFEALWTLGMNDDTTPRGALYARYDRTGDPVKIELAIDRSAFGTEAFGYRYAGWAEGSGVFDYSVRDVDANVLVIETAYDAAGAGRAHVTFYAAAGGVATYDQCWDAGPCLVWVDDPGNHSCVPDEWPGSQCSRGDAAACVPVPASPFPPL